MGEVRCAIIGAGHWAAIAHIPEIKNHPDADLVVLQTLDEGLAKMKKSQFTEQQIAFGLRQAESGVLVEEITRKMGITPATRVPADIGPVYLLNRRRFLTSRRDGENYKKRTKAPFH